MSVGRRLADWWSGLRSIDPYWDGFINRPFFDPKNDLTVAIQGAPPGRLYAAKSGVADPVLQSGYIRELAAYFGATFMGIAALDPAFLQVDATDASRTADTESADTVNVDALVKKYRFGIVAVMPSRIRGLGMGGRYAQQRAAMVASYLSAYIRELGYDAVFLPGNSPAVAVAAGLGWLDRNGRFVTKKHGTRLVLTSLVLTDLPLALDDPGQRPQLLQRPRK